MNKETNTFVIYNKNTGERFGMEYGSYKEWKTAGVAKGTLTRLKKKHLKAFENEVNQHMDYITKVYANGDSRSSDCGDNKFVK